MTGPGGPGDPLWGECLFGGQLSELDKVLKAALGERRVQLRQVS